MKRSPDLWRFSTENQNAFGPNVRVVRSSVPSPFQGNPAPGELSPMQWMKSDWGFLYCATASCWNSSRGEELVVNSPPSTGEGQRGHWRCHGQGAGTWRRLRRDNTAQSGSAGTAGTRQHLAQGVLPQSQAETWTGAFPSGGIEALPAAGLSFSGQERGWKQSWCQPW